MIARTSRSRQRGFNLIEVMAAVLVVVIGLLGLAKLEAVAVNETTTSDLRSLVAIQVQSLAAAMHANPGYWQTSLPVASPCSNTGATVCAPLSTVFSCGQITCSPTQIAAADVQSWVSSMNTLLPAFTYGITCQQAVTNSANSSAATQSVYSCTIVVNWTEKYVAVNKAVAAADVNGKSVTSSYTTTVWP